MAIASEIKSEINMRPSLWRTVVLLTLGFWLSGSLLLDAVVMPVLYASGMMVEPGFASAGYSMFWVFNRLELLCAALVLTSVLVLRHAHLAVSHSAFNSTPPIAPQQPGTQTLTQTLTQRPVLLAGLLLLVVLVYTYGLAPQMSGLGLQLNLFSPIQETPVRMDSLHIGYWLLELTKLLLGGLLVKLCWQSPTEAVQ